MCKSHEAASESHCGKMVEELRKETADSEMFSAIEIAGPGFINLKLAPFLKQDVVREILKEGPAYGCSDAHTGESILLEYVSANRPDLFIWAMQDRAH